MEIQIIAIEERTEEDKKPMFELFINKQSKGTFFSVCFELDAEKYLITGIDRK